MQDTIEINNKNLRLQNRIIDNIIFYGLVCIILFSIIIAFSDIVMNEKIKYFLFFFAILLARVAIKYHESTYYIVDLISEPSSVKIQALKFNSTKIINTVLDKISYEVIYSKSNKNEITELILQINKGKNNDKYKISKSNNWTSKEMELLAEYFKYNIPKNN